MINHQSSSSTALVISFMSSNMTDGNHLPHSSARLPGATTKMLQLCRAQSSNSTPEWYAANDINDNNFSPKPITELFSTETSFSPEDPIVVLSPSSSLPANRGIVSSPTPITLYNDRTDNQPPPNVIPLSSTELPSLPPQTTFQTPSNVQPQGISTIPQEASMTQSNPPTRTTPGRLFTNPVLGQLPRGNIAQSVRQNQSPIVTSRLPQQQVQPRNLQFLLPTQSGNRIFQGQQLPSNGQSNVFLLYEQASQNMRNIPPANLPMPPQSTGISWQQSMALRDSQQQIFTRPNMVVNQQPQAPNQIPTQPNPMPPSNIPPPNIILFPQPDNIQQNDQTGQTPLNQLPNNNQQSNPVPIQAPDIQQPNNQYRQPTNQTTSPPYTPTVTVLRRRPAQRKNRVNAGRLNNRGPNRIQTPSTIPCQRVNNTVTTTPTATNTPKPVITIRLRPSTMSRNNLRVNSIPNTNNSIAVMPRQSPQVNSRNYDRCLNSCRDKKDRICASPERDIQINPDTLKGFPSMCHMACHNTFRSNPIYERITNGRCGKLRTRIQTVDKSKIRRDELKKSQYTIISNIPGTVVELAP